MLDLSRLKRMTLRRLPRGQWLYANGFLAFDYRFPRRTHIRIEGLENLPSSPAAFIAMNHTDRFNYWPFQYRLYRKRNEFTATWVKGKYYEKGAVGWMMDATGNIPLPSRGYVITTEFRKTMGRTPDGDTYRSLRSLADGQDFEPTPDAAGFFAKRGGQAAFRASFVSLFDEMMGEVARLNRQALEVGLHVLVFPQGTRSKRLSQGHTGLLQMAHSVGGTIVPVGCNGSDEVYPGDSPSATGGRIVYRVGRPIRPDDPAFAEHRVDQPYTPFSLAATERYGDRFQAMTDVVMDRINALLDPPYQYSSGHASDGVDGVDRFV